MTLAQDITRAFGGDWHGSYGAFPSPGHGKADRGMTVKDADSGTDVVFHSHNGADWRVVKDACRQRGLLPDRPRANDNCDGGAWRQTGCYEYVGADGTVAYRTVRKERPGERKRFVAQRPDGRGGWINGLGDVERIPYRLPDLIAADPAAPVLFVEGERKAALLADMGFVATAIAFGAKGWRDSYAKHFADRIVIFLPDNDQPGIDFGKTVQASIAPTAAQVAVLSLPGLRAGEDVVDWVPRQDHGADAEPRLRALIAAALMGNANADEDPIGEMISVASNAGVEPEPQEWIIDQMLPAGAVTTLFGDGGVGKTLAAMQFGVAVGTGSSIFGFETSRSPVLGFFCEDIDKELHRRFHSICQVDGVPEASVTDFLYQSRFGRESLLGAFSNEGRFIPSKFLDAVRARALATGSRLIILDNIMHLFAGNQNDNGEITRFLAALNRLALDINGSVLLLGHIAKTAGSEFSGGMAWSNASRSRLFFGRPGDLEKLSGNDDDAVADPDERIIARLKANYAAISAPIPLRWYQGAFVRPGDVPRNAMASLSATVQANAENARFLKCLAVRTDQKRPVSDSTRAGASYAPKAFAAMTEASGMKSAQFSRAMERLFSIGQIERGELPFDKPGSRGHKAEGLRLSHPQVIENIAPQSAPTTSPEVRPAYPQVVENISAPVRLAHTGKVNLISGAAPGGPPRPAEKEEGSGRTPPIFTAEHPKGRSNGGMILTPGESADDPVPGWE